MKHKFLFFILSACMAIFISNIVYADIDLDLGDEPEPTAGYSKTSYVTLKGGFDMNGKLEGDESIEAYWPDYDASDSDSNSGEEDAKNGFSFSFEAAGAVSPMFLLGIGLSYQLPRGIDASEAEDLKFNFLPIYGLAKLQVDAGTIIPFAVLHLGWGLMFANSDFKDYFGDDISGGFYWGLGGGIMLYNGVQIELLYTVNRGKSAESGSDYDSYGDYFEWDYEAEFVYSKITISAGISF